MAMNFEELNEQTRQRMLDEFEQEQARAAALRRQRTDSSRQGRVP